MERLGRHAVLALMVALVALAQHPANAEVVSTTSYGSHPVKGTTPKSVLAYMNAHPIIDPDDGPAYANLTHDHTVSIRTGASGGACRVSSITFRWQFVLTLPTAVDYARMDGATKSMWNAFLAAMKRHEETHRAIFLGCAKKFVPAAERLVGPASCAGLERKVRQSIDKAYQACMNEQRAFEKRDRPRILGLPFVRAATR
ncbi:MAG: DUF922 domain-containing protein [Bauldia sp.]|nr:DUF922 domain-containing protein [Bauldia sp.]